MNLTASRLRWSCAATINISNGKEWGRYHTDGRALTGPMRGLGLFNMGSLLRVKSGSEDSHRRLRIDCAIAQPSENI